MAVALAGQKGVTLATFGERLTPELERALPSLVQQIASDLARLWK